MLDLKKRRQVFVSSYYGLILYECISNEGLFYMGYLIVSFLTKKEKKRVL